MIKYSNDSIESGKRRKVRENKTFMAPKPIKEIPELPELDLPKESKFLRLFKRKKKETDMPSQEPEVLREIDLGHHDKVEPELSLWLNDGRVVKSLEELKKALRTISTRNFNSGKREISEWVRDILGKEELSASFRKAKNKKDAVASLEAHKETKAIVPAVTHAMVQEPEMEIEHAISKVSLKKASPDDIDEQERLLDLEEEHLNKKRIELANKRYNLIKKRGEMERKKFDELVGTHKAVAEKFAKIENVSMPELHSNPDYDREKLENLLQEARNYLAQGDSRAAEQIKKELHTALDVSNLAPDEAKRMEYEILELEADIKLAALA